MNFSTTNATYRQLMGNGLLYKVPPFQRDYSWTEDEWDDLWQDILGLFEEDGESAHYLGYLVLQSRDNKRFDILDGQQRITTVSVMILAGLSFLQDLVEAGLDAGNNQRRKDQLLNSYIGYMDPVSLVPHSKLELNRHNNRYYQSYMVTLDKLPQRGLNTSEHQLRKAFNWFKERFRSHHGTTSASGKAFAALIDAAVDKIFFTVITVTDELNAFKVFETLNARGVRLSATDLLKNYLFSLISTADSHETEIRSLEERWERIVGLLGSESFPEFLRVFWNSRNKLVRKSDLFKTIRRRVTTKELAFALVRDLDGQAAVYAALRDPQDPLWNPRERQALEQLQMFSVRQPYAMLMACHQRFFEHERRSFTQITCAVSIISFRYNVICNLQTHEQERIYNEVAWKLTDDQITQATQVLAALDGVYPNDTTFKAAFAEKELRTTNSRNKKIVRYILFTLEHQNSGKSFDMESATYNLEHILPEHPTEPWSYIEEAKQDRLLYRLGNMTPLDVKANRNSGNATYDHKRTIYATSEFSITKSIAEHYDRWDEQKIDARQKQMAKIATSIWRLNLD